MKIAICIKQVPVVSMIRFDNETRRLVRDGVPSEVNYFDVLAMSALSNLKDEMPVEVVVFTMGPPQARDALVQCLAMGADRAVHLVDSAFAGSDTLATARAMSVALRREKFDLIICGRRSVDAETGQVGPQIAEMLDMPQITGATSLELADSGESITVERLTDEGREVVRSRLPALITVAEGIAPEAYPRREAVEASGSKPIAELTAADLSDDPAMFGIEGSPTWVNAINSVEPGREALVVRDKPVEEAVGLLVDYLQARGVFDSRRSSGPDARPRGPRTEPRQVGAIWVVAEILGNEIRPVTLELLGRSRELAAQVGATVEAVLLGDGVERHLRELTAYGADCVHLAESPALVQYDTESYTAVLADAIGAHSPFAVLMSATENGRDLASRLSARLGLGLTGDCVGLEIDDDGRLAQLKPAYGGNIVAQILSRTMPQMATIRPGIMTAVSPDPSIEPVVRRLSLEGMAHMGKPRVRVLERVADASAEGADLDHARRIVAVGRGVGSPENVAVVRELALTLGAAVGATREVVDLGWLPRQYQIGLSGKAVAPDLYIAVGVRGPFNHTVGIQKAGTVVAINNSARSPIFKATDFGIVGDFAEVVPTLVSALNARSLK